MKHFLENNGLYIAWVIAIIATGGSLFFSEVLHWVPCTMCWFQRIFMYPQVILLGIAVLKNDRKIWLYSVIMSAVGFCFSTYHYLIQHVPALAPYAPCTTTGVPCEATYLGNIFGFVTIPFLAGLAFLLIGLCMSLVGTSLRTSEDVQHIPAERDGVAEVTLRPGGSASRWYSSQSLVESRSTNIQSEAVFNIENEFVD